MTTKGKVILLAAVFLLLAGGVVLVIAIREHDARIEAEATSKTQDQVIADAQKQIDAAKMDSAKVAADLQRQLAAITAQRRIVPTPQQVVVDVSKLIPNLPRPLEVQSVPATAAAPATKM